MTQNQKTKLQVLQIKDSSSLLGNANAMRMRFEEDGYLYLRGLLAKDKLQKLQEEIFGICKSNHWFSADATSFEKANPCVVPSVEGEAAYFDVYDKVQRLEDFHSLAHEPTLISVMQTLLDETAFPHPLSICRLIFPNNPETTTPPHQDYPNNQGTTELYACWIPLSDCPMELGGLAFVPGSHKSGLLPLQFSLGAGNRQAVLTEALQDKSWVAGNYQRGDVLIFHSLMLHRALVNQTSQMRVSVDYRYQSIRDPLTIGCIKPHFQRESWEKIYSTWTSKRLQFYWERLPLTFIEWNDQYHKLPEGHMQAALGQAIRYNRRRQTLAKQLKIDNSSD